MKTELLYSGFHRLTLYCSRIRQKKATLFIGVSDEFDRGYGTIP